MSRGPALSSVVVRPPHGRLNIRLSYPLQLHEAGPRKRSQLCESLLVPELPGPGELDRREPTKCAVGSLVIVFVSPVLEKAVELLAVEELVSKTGPPMRRSIVELRPSPTPGGQWCMPGASISRTEVSAPDSPLQEVEPRKAN